MPSVIRRPPSVARCAYCFAINSLGTHILLGFSGVLFGFRGVPRFLVNGARTTRCLSCILPLPIVNGVNSFDCAPLGPAIFVHEEYFLVGVRFWISKFPGIYKSFGSEFRKGQVFEILRTPHIN